MNCVIYLRVSTKEQAEKGLGEEGYSIPAQRKACLNYVKEKGWNVIDEYVDRGESARSTARPQLQQMLVHLKEDSSINAVVVHKIDRLARNMEDHVAIRALFKKQGVILVSVTERIEETASGKLVENIFASFAEFYSANLGAEASKGMSEKARQGGWPNYAPIGYLNVQEIVSGKTICKVELDKERAPYIKQAFKMYATGNCSISQLTEQLSEMGLRTRPNRKYSSRPVPKSTLARMLQNPFYIGLIKWKDILVEGHHKPLVSKELFYNVQSLIRSNDVTSIRSRVHNHYLKGTVFCGDCGSRMSIDTAKNSYTYLYCLGRKRRNGCHQKYVDTTEVEARIEELYNKIELAPEWIRKMRDKFEQELIERQSIGANEEVVLRKRLVKLAEERTKLLHAYFVEAIPVDLLKKEQDRITGEIKTAEERLEQINCGDNQVKKILDIALSMCQNCGYAYKKAKPQARRLFNQAIFKKIYVQNRKIDRVDYSDLFGLFFQPKKILAQSSNMNYLAPGVGFEPTTH